jgi:Tfp pilus assembly protein PilF
MKAEPGRLHTSDPPAVDRFVWTAIVVFAVAFGLRLINIWQIRRAPFFTVLLGDSREYDAWAQRIAGGDWLGSDVFYQAPLYPYFLGSIYAVAGRDLLLVRVCQAILGSAACVLLGLAARRLWSRGAGLVAGLALALYAPAIFFDGILQKTVLDVFFVCLALWLMSAIISADAPTRLWLFLGLAMGGLALTRENAMVFVAVIAAWIVIGTRPSTVRSKVKLPRDSAPRTRALTAFAIGVAIVLVPVAVRNSIVGGGFYVTTSQFGPNLYLGNNATADGTAQSLRVGRGSAEYERQDATELAEHGMGRRLTPSEVSQYWTDRAIAYITSQPGAWLMLMARKFALLWNAREMLDTESQESYAEWSAPIRLGSFVGHFGVLVPLALFGLMATWGERRRLWVFYAMVAAYSASVLIFFIYARYRFPLVPFLILFASPGITELVRFIRSACGHGETRERVSALRVSHQRKNAPDRLTAAASRGRESTLEAEVTRGGGAPRAIKKVGHPPDLWQVLAATTAIGIVAIFTNWPVLSADLMRAVTEHNLAAALQTDGRIDDAIVHYRRALAFKPDHAPALNNLGTALMAKGDVDGAIQSYERALAVEPGYSSAHFNLANALMRGGQPAKAAEHFRLALEASPGSADVYNNLGIALADEGRFDDAIAEFRKALQFDPSSAKTHRNLGNVLASAERRQEAIASLQRAVQLDARDGPAHYDLATLLLEAQRTTEAIDELRAALALMPDSVDVHNNLGIALASTGRLDEAIEIFHRALSLQPDFAPARRNLEAALQQRRQQARPPGR